MRKLSIILGTFLFFTLVVNGQKDNVPKKGKRFSAQKINGVYIPRHLEDCFVQIDNFWNDSTKNEVKSWTENEFTAKAHHGFGMWMRNNWRLWGGSRLSKYFNEKGIYHPDDMSGIILTSYHRYLTGNEIKLDEQVKFYQNYWEAIKKN